METSMRSIAKAILWEVLPLLQRNEPENVERNVILREIREDKIEPWSTGLLDGQRLVVEPLPGGRAIGPA